MRPRRRLVLRAITGGIGAALLNRLPAYAATTPPPLLLRLNIPGPHSLPFLPFELIPRLGLDQRMGARLSLRYFPSGVRALDDVVRGNADFAGLGFAVLPHFQQQGTPVVAVAANSGGTPPFAILARTALKDHVKSIRDLRGLSIGVPAGNPKIKTYLQTVVETLLNSYGIGPDEVRWVSTAHSRDGVLGALQGGVVDALFCEEPFITILLRQKSGYVLADFADPQIQQRIGGIKHLRSVVATTRVLVEREPRKAELMVSMLRESLQWLHRSSAEEIVNQLGLPDDAHRNEMIEVLKNTNMYSLDGSFSAQQIQETLTFLRSTGTELPEGFDIQSFIEFRWAGRRP